MYRREKNAARKRPLMELPWKRRRAKKGWKEKITACQIERTSTDGNRKPEVHLARMQWPPKATAAARAMATGHEARLMLMAWVPLWWGSAAQADDNNVDENIFTPH